MLATSTGRFGLATPLAGRWRAAERQGNPLLVCLHGGGFDGRYFDAPRCSILSRPGYPADDDSVRSQSSFSEAADILAEVIADVGDGLGARRLGTVLVGHWMGAAIAVHMAARKARWPLLGLRKHRLRRDTVDPDSGGAPNGVPANVCEMKGGNGPD